MPSRCPCGGRELVFSTRTVGMRRTRYVRCNRCGKRSKQIVQIGVDGDAIEMPKSGLLCSSTHFIATCRCCGKIQSHEGNLTLFEGHEMSLSRWKAEVRKYKLKYPNNPAKAVRAANAANPGLRQRAVAEYNEENGRSHVVNLRGRQV